MLFTGFTKTTIGFLNNLAVNNNKLWFENNRSTYETHILTPLKHLSTELSTVIFSIDKEIEIAPQVNKTISRIYRDIRFSKDKSPFRTDQWLTFKRPNKRWGNVPEFYFYFTPEEYQYGMGYYSATPENMKCFREHIHQYSHRFKKIIETYENQDCFRLVGENYKKHIPNDLSEKFQPWYQKKNIAVSCTVKIDHGFYSGNLVRVLTGAYKFNEELYLFITESIS